MKTFWARIVLLLGCAALLASCAQNRYFPTSSRIGEARETLAKAKAAGAETKAPMDYYMAQEYLTYADMEAVELGDNEQGSVFAEKSKKHAEAALQKAGGGAK